MNRKIAIITGREISTYSDHDDDYSSPRRVVESITDWEEVSEEDYRLLLSCQNYLNFSIIEQPTNQKQFIEKSIASWKKRCEETQRLQLEQKQAREAKALAAKIKKQARTREAKLKLLEQLKAELGEQSV